MKKFYFVLVLLAVAIFGRAQSPLDNVSPTEPIGGADGTPEIYTIKQAKALGVKFESDKSEKSESPLVSIKATEAAQYAHGFGLEGYVTIPLTRPAKTTVDFKSTYGFSAGTRVDDSLLLIEYSLDASSSMHSAYLDKYDMSTKSVSRILAFDSSAPLVVDMTYSSATGQVFCLGVYKETIGSITYSRQALFTLDTTTGAFTKFITFNDTYMSIAASRAGMLYVVTKTGQLSSIDPRTGHVTTIGTTTITKTATYISGMDMDFEANVLYWALCDSNGASYLVSINPTTGAGKVVGRIGTDNEEVVAMNVDRYTPESSSPAKVKDLVLTPGANGATTATIQWTNPSVTVGGTSLSSLSKVEVYLNGNLYKELNTAPGEVNSLALSGLSTNYNRLAVTTYNGDAQSETAEVMKWIGLDVPNAPTNVTLERTSPSLATLKWNAPTGNGLHDGYVKASALKYRITRKSADGDSVVVAKTYRKDCTYLDSTITSLSCYSYTIQSLTSDYGDIAESPEVVLGPALDVPYYCTFSTTPAFKQWTTRDENGDGKCWLNYSSGKYAYNLPKSGVKADDWLMSPPLKLKADSTYYIYFEYRSGLGEYYPKHFQVTYGKTNEIGDQKIIGDYTIASKTTEQARIALPVAEEGEYFISIHDISDYTSCKISIANFYVFVKHTGWLTGKVSDESGNPVADVIVKIPGSNVADTTATDGSYKLDFVPTGRYAVNYSKLDWAELTDSVDFVNDTESVHNVVLKRLPAYSVSGVLKDVNGKAVVNASVTLSGYGDAVSVASDESGKFIFDKKTAHGYNLKVEKIKYITLKDSIDLTNDTVLSLTMSPKVLAPSDYKAVASQKSVALTWNVPRDIFRHDDGTFQSQLGSLAGTEKTVNGAVFRTPAVLKSISWVTTSYQGPHDVMNLWIFDVTEDFKPTNKVLFNAMNVPTKGDEVWNTYELPNAVEAPNGFFLGVSYTNGMSSLATDTGTDEDYPFIPYTNYSTSDYTTNNWRCLDGSFIKRNHLIRATGDEIGTNPQVYDYKYVVWRFVEDYFLDTEKWTLLTPAEGISDLKLSDDITSLADGEYIYAIAAVYPGGQYSETLYSDNVTVKNSGVESVQLAGEFIVAPNPVNTELMVNMPCDRIELYSAAGVLSAAADNATGMSVANLENGIYLLKATIGKSVVIKRVIIKK